MTSPDTENTPATTAENGAATAAADLVVFTGPSLRERDLTALRELAARRGRRLRLRPPVRRLDLLELTKSRTAQEILMLDGEFGQRLAVSITEVRAVLATGQPLAGASSMGALRAVECHTLGMTGSGWVYEQYRCGAIDSDGDVALLYDPEDYTPVTVPLVNVRWLLAQKQAAGLLSAGAAQQALRVAKDLHFRDRRPSLLRRRWRQRLPAGTAEVLGPELDDERRDGWDRKRLDGLQAVRAALGADGPAAAA
ncbi:TfuA-like protein [Streptomyces sp. NPDC101225]|uniref:TfuA-like protein n=1 Tax=Streptomyces sp. NPDC101225 TaxID=3366135 RepID=UPI00381D0F2F